MQQLLIETVVIPEFSTGRHTPNSYQDHKSESSTHYPHLASRAAGFFKAHYHQEPDPTNSLLNICGYGGLVRFKKAMHPAWFM
ncbi:hypothetical protein NO938_005293 [Citrobacter freundii]|nr:hypothetical protein [Citrobacter freundii]EKW0770592.1 hypothetical protein [Citrobacter freundii]